MDNAEHTQDLDQSNNDSDLGNQVDEAIKSQEESVERSKPPPTTSPVQRGVEGIDRLKVLSHGDPKGFAKGTKTWT